MDEKNLPNGMSITDPEYVNHRNVMGDVLNYSCMDCANVTDCQIQKDIIDRKKTSNHSPKECSSITVSDNDGEPVLLEVGVCEGYVKRGTHQRCFNEGIEHLAWVASLKIATLRCFQDFDRRMKRYENNNSYKS